MIQQNGIQKLLICFQKILHFLKLKIFKKSVADSLSTYVSIHISPSVHVIVFTTGTSRWSVSLLFIELILLSLFMDRIWGGVHAKLLQLCLTLCNPIDCILPGSSIHGIFQARLWIGWPCPPPGDLPGIKPMSLFLLYRQAGVLPLAPPGKPKANESKQFLFNLFTTPSIAWSMVSSLKMHF